MGRRLPKLVIVLLILLGGIGGGLFALKRGLEHAQQSRRTIYVFDVAEERLSEEVALEYARKALVDCCEEGYALEAVEDDRATPPDRFLVRNAFDHNDGFILFAAKNSYVSRDVCVTLAGGKLTCVVCVPK